MNRPPAIVVVGDLHAGSSVGLMPPTFTTDDGNVIAANPDQAWLWSCWLDFWKRAEREYAVEVVIVNGDAPNGINARDAQILTANESDQVRFALDTLKPLMELQKRGGFPIYATRGTAFHSGAGGAREETIWREAGAVPDAVGRHSRWQVWLAWRNKTLHATHHVSIGSVYPHTSLAREMRFMAERAATMGYPLPDADIRSHVHRCYALEQGGRWMATAPAWQLATEFVHKVAPAATASIGGLILWQDERNDLQLRRLTYRQPPPRATAVPTSTPSSRRSKSAATKARRATPSAKSSSAPATARNG